MIACSGMACSGMVIMGARRSIPRPYHYKQPLTYLLIGS